MVRINELSSLTFRTEQWYKSPWGKNTWGFEGNYIWKVQYENEVGGRVSRWDRILFWFRYADPWKFERWVAIGVVFSFILIQELIYKRNNFITSTVRLSCFDGSEKRFFSKIFQSDKNYVIDIVCPNFKQLMINFIMDNKKSKILPTELSQTRSGTFKSNFTTINLHKGMHSSTFYKEYSFHFMKCCKASHGHFEDWKPHFVDCESSV